MDTDLRRIRSVADYQFGKGVGMRLFPDSVSISYSRRTGRIRLIFLDGKRLATMRPTDGLFSLSIGGAMRITENSRSAKCLVIVMDDIAKFVAEGSDLFAVHVVDADDAIRARDEVVVASGNGEILAVGRALLSGMEMKTLKRGVAVKVRRGRIEES